MAQLTPELEAALGSLGTGQDPLDVPNFDPVDYINQKFPTEASLAGVDALIASLHAELRDLDKALLVGVREQASSGHRARKDLAEAQEAIAQLVEKMQSIQRKAAASESMVVGVCHDIKQLDVAKKNLTATITALKRLVMFITAMDQLHDVAGERSYQEAAHLAQALVNLSEHFQELAHLPKIAELLAEKQDLLAHLRKQLSEDFDEQPPGFKVEEAALCVDAVDFRRDLLARFCLGFLEPYKEQFGPGAESAGLANVDKRYTWVRRAVRQLKEGPARFPESWHVSSALLEHFCHVTRQHLVEVLGESHHSVDPQLLIKALHKSIEFENELVRAYQAPEESRADAPRFKGIISECFEVYLGSWVEYEGQQLMESMYASARKPDIVTNEGGGADEDNYEPKLVYNSAMDLFASLKASLDTCSKFSVHQTMHEMTKVFKQVMLAYSAELEKKVEACRRPLSGSDIRTVCAVCGTSEYAESMVPMLQDSVARVIDPAFKDKVNFENEEERLGGLLTTALRALISSIVGDTLDPAFKRMSKVNWLDPVEAVEGSAFSTEVREALNIGLHESAQHLSLLHFRFFCDQLAQAFVGRYMTEIFKCRKIGESGAAQLLLDTYAIKAVLLSVPEKASGQAMPEAFTKYVHTAMGRAETIFKALSAGTDEAGYAAFVGTAAETPEQLDLLLSLRPSSTSVASAEQLRSAQNAFGLVDTEQMRSSDATQSTDGLKNMKEGMRKMGNDIDSSMAKVGADMKKNAKKFFSFGGNVFGHSTFSGGS